MTQSQMKMFFQQSWASSIFRIHFPFISFTHFSFNGDPHLLIFFVVIDANRQPAALSRHIVKKRPSSAFHLPNNQKKGVGKVLIMEWKKKLIFI
jgi:predicted RNase H-like nuclease